MKKGLWLSGVVLLGGLSSYDTSAQQNSNMSLSPKLVLRTGGGVFRNVASGKKKSAPSVGGINVAYHYFLSPQLSAGIGYKAEFDIVRSTLPFKGFDVSGRYYPWTQGTYYTKRFGENILEFHDSFSQYFVMDFSQRSYLLAGDGSSAATAATAAASVLRGSFAAINFGVGGEMRMSRHFELNAEIITSLFSLASSDTSVRISSTFLNLGVCYVW